MAGENSIKDNLNVAYSYDQAIELTGNGKYSYLLLVTCSLLLVAVSLDMFGMSVVTEAAKCDLQLDIFAAGLLNSMPMIGIVIFAFPWGYFADLYGRRRALLLSTTGGFIFGTLSSFSPDWRTMAALKFVGCSFSIASSALLVSTYLGECVSSARRRRCILLVNTANLGAEIFVYGLAYFILPLNFSIPVPWLGITLRSWRLYNFALIAPLGICTVFLLALYESPKILASMGKMDQALEVLEKIYRRNGGKGEYPVKSLTIDDDVVREKGAFWKVLTSQTLQLLKPGLLWRTIQLFHLIGLCVSTNNVFLIWYPMMVNLFFNSLASGGGQNLSFCERMVSNMSTSDNHQENFSCDDTIYPHTIYSGMLLGLILAIINLAATAVASRRKLILIATFTVSGVCLVLVDILREPVSNMLAFTLIQVTAVGIGVVATYHVDFYPTHLCGLVSSLSTMFMRLSSVACINIVGPLILSHCSATFYGWAVYVVSGIVVALYLPSDKKLYK